MAGRLILPIGLRLTHMERIAFSSSVFTILKGNFYFVNFLILFSALILQKLMELGVERLVLPAVPSVLNTWTTSFGFSKMTDSERLRFLDYSFLDFQDTVMCQKLLMKIPLAKSNQSTGMFAILSATLLKCE